MMHRVLNHLYKTLTPREAVILLAVYELTSKDAPCSTEQIQHALTSFSWDGGGSRELLRNLRAAGHIDYHNPGKQSVPITITRQGRRLLADARACATP